MLFGLRIFFSILFFLCPFYPCLPLCESCEETMREGSVYRIAYRCLDLAGKIGLWSPYVYITRHPDWICSYLEDCSSYSVYREKILYLSGYWDEMSKGFIAERLKKIREYELQVRKLKQSDLDYAEEIAQYQKLIADKRSDLIVIRQRQSQIDDVLQSGITDLRVACDCLYTTCIAQHGDKGSFYQRSLIHFDEGKSIDCVADIQTALATGEQTLVDDHQIEDDLYYLQGRVYSDLGLYQQAIEALTEAIRMNPDKKDAYLERAAAYFALGDLEFSLADFLASGVASKPVSGSLALEYASGFVVGAIQGAAKGVEEFAPSILNSMRGLGNALWSYVSAPAQFSQEMVRACKLCSEFLIAHSTAEILVELVPELKTLVENWDSLTSCQKGELMGCAIGQHGVEIFASAGMMKGVKVYQGLRRANLVMTMEAYALSQETRVKIFQESAKRWELRQTAFEKETNRKIIKTRQGKHIKGDPNYESGKSILDYSNPQELVDRFAGTGMRCRGDIPGAPGYQEIVNFKEPIGFVVDQYSGLQTITTWGKIHYAKDGVHIVPTLPRGYHGS